MKINLHIEKLVLDGIAVDRTQGSKLRAAVEQELTRLLAHDGLSAQLSTGGAIPQLRGGNIKLRKGSPPGSMGVNIAHAVHEGIARKP